VSTWFNRHRRAVIRHSISLRKIIIATIILSAIVTYIGVDLLNIGIPLIEKAQDENKSEIKVLEIPKVITYHDEVDSTSAEEFQTIYSDWTTNDTFSVDNNLRGDITVILQKNTNIIEIASLQLAKGTDLSWTNDGKLIPPQLDKIKKSRHYTNGYSRGNDTYLISFQTKPATEAQLVYVVMLKFHNDQNNTDTWSFSVPMDFPKIYPYTAKLQAETDRAVQRQVLESEITNDTIGGLTWVIVGLVPLGLVTEFWIEYVIENRFSRR